MLLTQWPLSVVMQRRLQGIRWQQLRWSAVAVLPAGYDRAQTLHARADADALLVLTPGLVLELHSDELDGYFENWAAPAPKVFVSWRMQARHDGERAVPVQVSVSYAEGARMFDGGDGADGVDMALVVRHWLCACLAQHHRVPRPRHGAGAVVLDLQHRSQHQGDKQQCDDADRPDAGHPGQTLPQR